MTKYEVESTQSLLRELWQAATNLRGVVGPAEYKHYVLPLIFLRFLSVKYEQRKKDLEELVRDPRSGYFSNDDKVIQITLSDIDEYRRVGAFIVPENARWDYIRKNAQSDDIKIILDDALESLEDKYPEKLKGLFPRIFAASNLDNENARGLINLFSRGMFSQNHIGIDLLGQVYEYFIGAFADAEGKRGGEYFTPPSIVKTLVAMLEPKKGVAFDPCCGAGGMFVTCDTFSHHNRQLSFLGQESVEFTYRLCRMNLFIHGIDGDIALGNSYFGDKHPTLRADFVLANPPFNDGSKSRDGWGTHRITDGDPRLVLGNDRMPLAPRNANTMWMMHFLSHLNDTGTAGFVMATGELSNSEKARLKVRKTLVEQGYVDCIVQMPGQLFANTQIPCCLWFLSKNRDGRDGFRKRNEEILFIDSRKMGSLIPGSRKQKQLSEEEIENIAVPYRQFKREGTPDPVLGFCAVATLEEVGKHNYALTPGRYVGVEKLPEDDELFEDKMVRLTQELKGQFTKSAELEQKIRKNLENLGYDF